ncbi:fluoride efflux transporter FluC [Geodermatophilus sp. URMC 64]
MAVDPDVGPRERRLDPAVLAAIAVGGVLGSEGRFALERWVHSPADTWPWATWWINLSGSFLLGVLMVVITERIAAHRLLRPLLGVGVLGGFTTFSTAMVEVHGLGRAGRPGLAVLYLAGTAVAALCAAALGATLTRRLPGRRRDGRS